ncbi:hypothetical protein MJO28_011242 [Puccinia striiformis f. sp. tritici]|uniref:Uncharacterized protein n=2 Tax=Puccinia striiformis f. sp. tritici TaxID=168172 RepID=A0A0L0VGJ0_9BASI|nr:uncharacterized protein Pst134EA_031616 [Puccinia striiformis f. sp. tritici]XP_047802251.1 hypothetical protein Pst134EA_020944 [Puccinia striiformis f. sp. tritici]KNE98407.1 hypothetical protein, variant [Puccinia striiformis f. sp. tritici PST-78]KAH9445217.1 hypothetical protein Pst134EA_031616 [Puccinia striiformis f. sp. tritici]KAH9447717.1 hypothetical protein Pst134EB_021719 [Puccinia striiformis f. sp. tritici]KAH9457045.1 hypothetical protein Pst134EA_020944 [Puccinia striiformi
MPSWFNSKQAPAATNLAKTRKASKEAAAWQEAVQRPNLEIQTHSNTRSNSDEVEVLTQSLAIRLEELATANNDGLLDDDEYRTLRQGLFDQVNASNQVPVLVERPSNLTLSSPEQFNQQQIPVQSYSPKSIHTTAAPTLRSTRSTRSTSSFLHMIFRRPSRIEETESSPPENNIRSTSSRAGSIYSTNHSESGQSSFMSNNHHPPHSSPSAGSANGKMRMSSNSQLSSSMRLSTTAPGLLSSSPGRNQQHQKRSESAHNPSSLPASSASPASRRRSSTYMSSNLPSPRTINDNFQHQDYRQIEWSSTEIKQEILELENECSKLLESFNQMEKDLIAKYRTLPRSGPTGPITKLEELEELFDLSQQQGTHSGSSRTEDQMEIDEQDESSNSRDSSTKRASTNPRPISFLAPLLHPRTFSKSTKNRIRPTHNSRNSSISSSSILSNNQPSILSTNQNENLNQSHRNSISSTTSSSRPTRYTPPPSSSSSSIHHQHPSVNPYGLRSINQFISDPNQEFQLQIEIDHISQSRLNVQNKYHDRLVYLRAKLKGALIRELSS